MGNDELGESANCQPLCQQARLVPRSKLNQTGRLTSNFTHDGHSYSSGGLDSPKLSTLVLDLPLTFVGECVSQLKSDAGMRVPVAIASIVRACGRVKIHFDMALRAWGHDFTRLYAQTEAWLLWSTRWRRSMQIQTKAPDPPWSRADR
jgi:hypothetical protein